MFGRRALWLHPVPYVSLVYLEGSIRTICEMLSSFSNFCMNNPLSNSIHVIFFFFLYLQTSNTDSANRVHNAAGKANFCVDFEAAE